MNASKRRKIVLASLMLVVTIGYLIYTAMTTATVSYFITVEQALNGEPVLQKFYRIEGKLDVTNTTFDTSKNPVELRFAIYHDANPEKKLTVIYNGLKPDNFTGGATVVVEGRFNPDGTFQAQQLMPKCPNKYENVN